MSLQIKNPDEENIELQLGDIIRITGPSDELNDKIFIIDYIDTNEMLLINDENLTKITLTFDENGAVNNYEITAIVVLDRADIAGYALQHDLLVDSFIEIEFINNIKIFGTIIDLNVDEDSIAIETNLPNKNIIYLNFNFRGIPHNMGIETIKKINALPVPIMVPIVEQIVEPIVKPIFKPIMPPIAESVESPNEEMIFEEEEPNIIYGKIEYSDAILEPVNQIIELNERQFRYSIEEQTSDMLEQMLALLPKYEQTPTNLKEIHTIITRFKQLRSEFSIFDINNKILSKTIFTATWKPLVPIITNFQSNLYWILYVGKQVKKLYSMIESSQLLYPDNVLAIFIDENLIDIKNIFTEYYTNNDPAENKYNRLINKLNQQFTPYENAQEILPNYVRTNVNNNLNIILDNNGEIDSYVANTNKPDQGNDNPYQTKKFLLQTYNTGLTQLHSTKSNASRMYATRIPLTTSDTLDTNSIMTLPEEFIRFSRVNLPGTNILNKSNLGLYFLNYWELFNNININRIEVDVNSVEQFVDEDFASKFKINQYILKNELENRPDGFIMTDELRTEMYNKFIYKIIPKTIRLFNLVKKYITKGLSFVQVVEYLEPFMIYNNHITYKQYSDINDFIQREIEKYKKEYITNTRLVKNIPKMVVTNSQFSNISTTCNKIIFNKYGYPGASSLIASAKLSTSELLRNIIMIDYGKLYNSAVAIENNNLTYSHKL